VVAAVAVGTAAVAGVAATVEIAATAAIAGSSVQQYVVQASPVRNRRPIS
jgi:hypothetical protein